MFIHHYYGATSNLITTTVNIKILRVNFIKIWVTNITYKSTDVKIKIIKINVLEEMMKTWHTTGWPFKSFLCMSQITHDESVFPSTLLCPRTSEVTWRRRTIVHRSQSKQEVRGQYERPWTRILRDTHRWPTSWAATMIPEKPPVSSMMATLLTFSRRLLTTQAPPTYANPGQEILFLEN